jgi:hypothetical protein
MRCNYWELAVDLPTQVRPIAKPPARSTVDDVRLGLRTASRQTQGDRPDGSAAPRAGLSSLGLQRLGLHRAADPGGRAFAIVTVLPTLMITAWLLPGLPLLLAGRFFPVPMVLISVPLAVGLVLLTNRHLPGRWPGPGTKERFGTRGRTGNWSAVWGLAGTLLVAAGFGIWQLRVNSPQLIVDRDPGAFFQFAYWIAEHGSLPIPDQLAAFGGSHAGLTFGSFGFAGQGDAVVPGLQAGLPITLAAGLWTHGLAGGVALSPLLGALAVLSVGGLTGRLAGPQWAPAGAFLLALTLPETYTSRSAFSQIVAQALLFGGLCLVVDSLAPRQSRTLAALGGLALGLTVLVEIGSLVNLLPVIVFLGTLLAVRRPQALPFAGGLVAGTGYGLAGGFVLAGPMMAALAPELGLVALAAAAFLALTVVGGAVGLVDPVRRNVARLFRARPLRWLPEAGAVIVVAVAAVLLIRPYLQRVAGTANPYVAALQRISQLPVDPRRLYAEDSLYWVVWYLGIPALLLGVAGLALLTRRCLRALITWQDPTGMARAWALPLMIIGWGAAAVLWLPHTMPDQPWASRQLVPVLLPGLIVAAIWVCALLAVRARERGAGVVAIAAAVACFVAALAVPSVVTTFGIGAKQISPPAPYPASAAPAFQRTGVGQLAAITNLCGAIPGDSPVLILDQVAARRFAQVIRGMCGTPAGIMTGATPAQVEAVVGQIMRTGHQAMLLATRPAELTPYGGAPRQVVNLTTVGDAHVLTQPPASGWPVRYVLWMSGAGAAGAAGGLAGGT